MILARDLRLITIGVCCATSGAWWAITGNNTPTWLFLISTSLMLLAYWVRRRWERMEKAASVVEQALTSPRRSQDTGARNKATWIGRGAVATNSNAVAIGVGAVATKRPRV